MSYLLRVFHRSRSSTNGEVKLESGFSDPQLELRVDLVRSPYVRSAIRLLKPSFITRSGLWNRKNSSTAYLDGLRGFAAFLVYWLHHELWAHESLQPERILQNTYGYDNLHYFACLPGIRTFFTGGHVAVAIFFVISGYVLAAKPLKLIQAGELAKLGDSLAPSLFKRWLRLHIPLICTTFAFMTFCNVFHIELHKKTAMPTYGAELWAWYTEIKNFTFVFGSTVAVLFSYNTHLWTIPIEFRGSLIIYTAVLAFSRFQRNARLWCEVALMFYFMYIVDGWYGSMFVAGMFLCDLDLLSSRDNLPRIFPTLGYFKQPFFAILFSVGIYLGGVPSENSKVIQLATSPGWYHLSLLKPQAVLDYKWFYLFWAAVCIVASVPRIRLLKAFFETGFCQYLGRISYAFYLVHGPILSVLGDRIYAVTGWSRVNHAVTIPPGWVNRLPLPKFGPFGLELGFLLPHLIILPVTFWTAEMVTKFCDEPSIKIPQWIYAKMVDTQKDVDKERSLIS